MHFELAALLERAVLKVISGRYEAKDRDRVLMRLGGIQVADCSQKLGGVLTSNIGFQLATVLTALSEDESLPEQREASSKVRVIPTVVSQSIADSLSENAESRFFSVNQSASGHLNFSPTDELLREFLEAIFLSENLLLFQRGSFVVNKPPSVCARGFESFRWEDFLARCESSSNRDIKLLLKRQNSRGFSAEASLMLLCLMYDPEIEVAPFIAGISSRQNIPWYIRRFFYDSERFLSGLYADASKLGLRERLRELGFGFEKHRLGDRLKPATLTILKFRSSLFLADRLRRPELLMGGIIELTQAFYRYYNYPEVRAVAGPRLEVVVLDFIGITEILRRTVREGLVMLQTSCDIEDFVLEQT